MKYNLGNSTVFALLLYCLSNQAVAQHSHGRRNTVELEYDSIPTHDEILVAAPNDMILRFNEYVRLVKLTLKAEDTRNITINFKFSNEYSKVFIQDLPALDRAEYYTAEWAALNANNVIVYGYFSFSFGPNAKRATSIINSKSFPLKPF